MSEDPNLASSLPIPLRCALCDTAYGRGFEDGRAQEQVNARILAMHWLHRYLAAKPLPVAQALIDKEIERLQQDPNSAQ